MDRMQSFWFLLILVAAWPLILVGVFAFLRRFPSGLPTPKRWLFWAALSPIYLVSSVSFFVAGENARGILFLVLGIAAAASAVDQRRRSQISAPASNPGS